MSELHDAADAGDVNTIHQAVSAGNDVNEPDLAYSHRTPLHVAADAGNADCVKALLSLDADPLARMLSGKTAAHLAAEGGVPPAPARARPCGPPAAAQDT